MNIFFVSDLPGLAAADLCDKHVVQMVRETAQLLATAHRVLDGELVKEGKKSRYRLDSQLDTLIPRATHHNHPSAVWVRQSHLHYDWLFRYFRAILKEYTYRYKKTHFYQQFEKPLEEQPRHIPSGCFIDPPQCMPDEYKVEGNCMQAYRRYYIGAKARFAKWNHATVPHWWPNQNGNGFIGPDAEQIDDEGSPGVH